MISEILMEAVGFYLVQNQFPLYVFTKRNFNYASCNMHSIIEDTNKKELNEISQRKRQQRDL
jgi:hypothetical protein